VLEQGAEIWVTCKESHHLVRVSADARREVTVYPSAARPIFVALHPKSGHVYASLDEASAIFCLSPNGEASKLQLPEALGKTPVGLIAGPDGNVWFVALGMRVGAAGASGGLTSRARSPHTTSTKALRWARD